MILTPFGVGYACQVLKEHSQELKDFIALSSKKMIDNYKQKCDHIIKIILEFYQADLNIKEWETRIIINSLSKEVLNF